MIYIYITQIIHHMTCDIIFIEGATSVICTIYITQIIHHMTCDIIFIEGATSVICTICDDCCFTAIFVHMVG